MNKPQDAGESIQIMEKLVDSEIAMEISPLKRRFEELDTGCSVKVKTERSTFNGPSGSGIPKALSFPKIKVEVETPNPVDEETSHAASILNGVAMNHGTVCNFEGTNQINLQNGGLPSMHAYPPPSWSEVQPSLAFLMS